MKYYACITILPLFLMLYSCGDGAGSRQEMNIKEKIFSIAEEYIKGQLKDPSKKDHGNGIFEFRDSDKRYVIDMSEIYTGLIDEDKFEDAIVTLYTFTGNFQTVSEQLIILCPEGRYILTGNIESDMKIVSIEDGVITADVPEHSRNNPLFNCPSCREIIRYRFSQGELARIE